MEDQQKDEAMGLSDIIDILNTLDNNNSPLGCNDSSATYSTKETMKSPTISIPSSGSSSPIIQGKQIQNSATENTLSEKMEKVEKPYIRIVEQPANKALRFRYECEGRSAGSIPGANSTAETKTFPVIEIANYKGEVTIVVSCVTKDPPYRPHPHNLVGKEGCVHGVYTARIKGDPPRAVLNNLGVQCVRRKDIKAALELRENKNIDPFKTKFSHKDQPSSIDLNVVRLCFQAFIQNGPRQFKKLQPVVSEPVYDRKAVSNLAINRLCSCSAKFGGGDEIIMLCEKVTKEIKIKFYELNDEGYEIWHDYAEFHHSDIHKNTAIAFKTPRYHNPDATQRVQVYIQLERPSDGATSEPLPFEYYPDQGMRSLVKTKLLTETLQKLSILMDQVENLHGNVYEEIDNNVNTEACRERLHSNRMNRSNGEGGDFETSSYSSLQIALENPIDIPDDDPNYLPNEVFSLNNPIRSINKTSENISLSKIKEYSFPSKTLIDNNEIHSNLDISYAPSSSEKPPDSITLLKKKYNTISQILSRLNIRKCGVTLNNDMNLLSYENYNVRHFRLNNISHCTFIQSIKSLQFNLFKCKNRKKNVNNLTASIPNVNVEEKCDPNFNSNYDNFNVLDDQMKLIAIADRETVINLCHGAYGVVLDSSVDLNEPQYFALYSTISTYSHSLRKFEKCELLTPEEVAKRLTLTINDSTLNTPYQIKRKRLKSGLNAMTILRRELQKQDQLNNCTNVSSNATNIRNVSKVGTVKAMETDKQTLNEKNLPNIKLEDYGLQTYQNFDSRCSPHGMTPSPQPYSLSPMNHTLRTPSPSALIDIPSGGSKAQMKNNCKQITMQTLDASSSENNINNNYHGTQMNLLYSNCNFLPAASTNFTMNNNIPTGLRSSPSASFNSTSGGSCTPVWFPSVNTNNQHHLTINPHNSSSNHNDNNNSSLPDISFFTNIQQNTNYNHHPFVAYDSVNMQVISSAYDHHSQQHEHQQQQHQLNAMNTQNGDTFNSLLQIESDQFLHLNSDDLKLSNLSIST